MRGGVKALRGVAREEAAGAGGEEGVGGVVAVEGEVGEDELESLRRRSFFADDRCTDVPFRRYTTILTGLTTRVSPRIHTDGCNEIDYSYLLGWATGNGT